MSWAPLGLFLFIFCQKGPHSSSTGERTIRSTVDYEEILISTWRPQFLCSTYLYLALPQAIILLAICPNFHTQTNDYCLSTNYVINCPSSVVSNLWLCPPPQNMQVYLPPSPSPIVSWVSLCYTILSVCRVLRFSTKICIKFHIFPKPECIEKY